MQPTQNAQPPLRPPEKTTEQMLTEFVLPINRSPYAIAAGYIGLGLQLFTER